MVTESATQRFQAAATEAISRCRQLAMCTEAPGSITRTFLSQPMHDVHRLVSEWMRGAGMDVFVDNAGNVRGVYAGANATRLYIASHLDTVPDAGAFDGILGVMMGIGLVEALAGQRLKYSIEVVGFSEEEGVRFGVPFIGSRAFIGTADAEFLSRQDADRHDVHEAIESFGLAPDEIENAKAQPDALGYVEFHIEQGPVLDDLKIPLAVVDSIVGQSRLELTFRGQSNHAGTTPMGVRRDALAAAAEWTCTVERMALETVGLVATVGRLEAQPGAGNVIAGRVSATLDVRHRDDRVRRDAVERLLAAAHEIADRRRMSLEIEPRLDQSAVPMDARLTEILSRSVMACGYAIHRMSSGAGHDAMIVARIMPTAMLFLRSPGGISHHPKESVELSDVAAALAVGYEFLRKLDEAVDVR